MQLRHLKTFVAVADTLNFSRAAERVHLSQSSVSEQIQALESDLGAALFDRSRRMLALTSAGERFLGHALEMLRLAEQAYDAVGEAAAAISGPLRIGGLETLCAAHLPALLAEFHRRHPAVQLTLAVSDSGGLRNAVLSGEMDLAFHYGEAPEIRDLQGETVADEALFVLVPPGHRLQHLGEIGSADLARERFLVTAPGCVYRKMFDTAFPASLEDAPVRVGEYASLATIRGLVEQGLGCALMPGSAVAAYPGATAIAWAGEGRSVPVTMLWRRRRTTPAAVSAFQSLAREMQSLQTSR